MPRGILRAAESATIWHWRTAAVWFILALAIRLVYVVETRNAPTLRHLVGDAAGYYQWAQEIAAGDWLGKQSFYQAPLYPYVLAVWFRIAGDEVWKVRCLQAVFGSFAVALIWFFSLAFFGRRIAVTAAVLLAFYPPAIFFDGIVQKSSLDGLMVCALLAAIAQFLRRRSMASSITAGVLLGLLSLTRENAIIWAPLIALWIWIQCRQKCVPSESAVLVQPRGRFSLETNGGGAESCRPIRAFTAFVAFVLGLAIVLVPVGARNRLVGGEWSLSTFQAGPNFYVGNHQGAPGYYVPLVRGHETPFHERADATRLAEQTAGRELTAREVSHFWMSKATREIRNGPADWLRLIGRKFMLLLNRYEVGDVESLYVYRESSIVLSALRFLHWGTILPLALLGVWLTRSEWRVFWVLHAMVASMAVSLIAFYVMARYRYPLAPLLMPFAAAAVVQVYDSWRARHFRRVATYLAVLTAVAIPVDWPVCDEVRLNALAKMNIGVALAQDGEIEQASAFFRDAVAAHHGSAEAHNNLAQSLALLGR
jgi:4-amino-4-deoxy-L-arabinose transferase-like glycosyltransferase